MSLMVLAGLSGSVVPSVIHHHHFNISIHVGEQYHIASKGLLGVTAGCPSLLAMDCQVKQENATQGVLSQI
ncbi:MAG: hypothetical protein IKI30_06200 [Oxalobacter sp.]|nr:hypothetical protein [Oxalobacter sp.]